MKTFFAYIRVSTVKQGEHGVSLSEQRSAIEQYAGRHLLPISRWFEEQQSAAVRGRPQFQAMLRELQSGGAAGVIIHKIDRSARNLGDWNEVTELLDRGIDVHVAHEAIDLRSRSGRLMGDIQAVLAADYSRNLREEVRKGIFGRFKQGLFPMPAPLGYCDHGSGKPKTIDPVLGPAIRQLFELYATGRYSLRSLGREADRLNLRSRKGVPLRRVQLANLLHNPFYTGIIHVRKTGQIFSGAHEPLVDRSTFDRVQSLMKGKGAKVVRHEFLLRRLLTCARCHGRMIGELQKGRVYYRCQRRGCPTTTVREDVAEGSFLEVLTSLRVTKLDRGELLSAWREIVGREQASEEQRRQTNARRLAQVQGRLERLTEAYLDGVLDKTELEQRKTALLKERETLESSGDIDQPVLHDDLLVDVLELADQACLLYQRALPHERRELIEILTSNRTVDGRTPHFSLASPFDGLADTTQLHTGGPSPATTRTAGAELPQRQLRTPRRSAAVAVATTKRLFKVILQFVATADASVPDRIHRLLHPAEEKPRPKHWFGRQAA